MTLASPVKSFYKSKLGKPHGIIPRSCTQDLTVIGMVFYKSTDLGHYVRESHSNYATPGAVTLPRQTGAPQGEESITPVSKKLGAMLTPVACSRHFRSPGGLILDVCLLLMSK